jgi:hypothetical protein
VSFLDRHAPAGLSLVRLPLFHELGYINTGLGLNARQSAKKQEDPANHTCLVRDTDFIASKAETATNLASKAEGQKSQLQIWQY